MLTVAVQEPAIIMPVERRLNHQILEEASKIEEKKFQIKRRNSDPPEIINIQEAHDYRMNKKIEEMNTLKRLLLGNSAIVSPSTLLIEFGKKEPEQKGSFHPSNKLLESISACEPLHGDIY